MTGEKTAKFYESLGLRIKNLREAQELNQNQLSEKAEISEKYLSKIERGCSCCSTDVTYRIAVALGVSVDYLITGKSEIDVNTQVATSLLGQLTAEQQGVIVDMMLRLRKHFTKGK